MATLTVPEPVPSPAEDADSIHKAVHGWGTHEKTLIEILTHRDATQRKLIQLAYEELYNESLTKRLESELKGNFEKAVYRWNFEPVEREAVMAYIALKKSFNFHVIIEIACVNSPDELLAVKKAYQATYRRSLEEDVAAHSVGDLRRLLVALVSTYRYDGEDIDVKLAKSEAKILQERIKDNELNHDEIIRILGTRSKAQIYATFNSYREEYGTSIEEALAGESTDEFAVALRAAVACIIDPHLYFVELLDAALEKSDEDTLTRIIVLHAEKDLGEIKDKFHKRKNVPLEHAVAKKTSGDYEAFLLALLGD
ncbi:annexin-like protein RJ4 [Curcuma longa]|uniref:annexin-like protein RJ4 n=1 Tax=Curcuma longa TaxID=136217 RepID=UPI003D9F3F96